MVNDLLLAAAVLIFTGSLFVIGMVIVNTVEAKRRLKEMKKDADAHQFNIWLDRADSFLHQYGASIKDRSEDDWMIDYYSGIRPETAARTLLGSKAK
jgi:hypothetical protein